MNPMYPIQLNNRGTWKTQKCFTSFFVCCSVLVRVGGPISAYLIMPHRLEFQTAVRTGLDRIKLICCKIMVCVWHETSCSSWILCFWTSWESNLWLSQESMSHFYLLFIWGVCSPCVSGSSLFIFVFLLVPIIVFPAGSSPSVCFWCVCAFLSSGFSF